MSAGFLSRPTSDDPVDDIVLLMHAFAGSSPFFDAATIRRLAAADVARTACLEAALTNHFVMRIDGPRAGTGTTSIPSTRCRTGRPWLRRSPARPCWCSPAPATTSHRSASGSSSTRSSPTRRPTPSEEQP
jgi:hypothetical protein